MTTLNPRNALLGGLNPGTLVPRAHARIVPLPRGGCACFRQTLDPARGRMVLAEQSSLPITAGTPARLARLLQCCPTPHKLGQLPARDARLSPDPLGAGPDW